MKLSGSKVQFTDKDWVDIGSARGWFRLAMGFDGQIQSYIKKVKSAKSGKEFYTLNLYGNTKPIKDYLGKAKRYKKKVDQGTKLGFSYYQGTWSKIIPEGFVQKITTGEPPTDEKEISRVQYFENSINQLKQGFDVDGVVYKADLSPLYEASNYSEETMTQDTGADEGVTDNQKAVKDMITGVSRGNQVAKLTQFIEAELKRISEMTDEAKQSAFVQSFLRLASQFYNYSYLNQLLIWIQKPNANRVDSRDRWREISGREVTNQNDSIWIRIFMEKKVKDADQIAAKMRAQGYSEEQIRNETRYGTFGTGPVYDVSATTPIPGWTYQKQMVIDNVSPNVSPYADPQGTQGTQGAWMQMAYTAKKTKDVTYWKPEHFGQGQAISITTADGNTLDGKVIGANKDGIQFTAEGASLNKGDSVILDSKVGPYDPEKEDNWRQDSNDSVEEITALVNAGIKWASGQGINVDVEKMEGSLGGWSAGGEIRINDTYDGINKFSTLVHECAHEVLHWEKGKRKLKIDGDEGLLDNTSRQDREIDAETTAFIVLQHFGFETVDTPNYLAIWGASGKDVMARKKNISESARIIINGISGSMVTIDIGQDVIQQMEDENSIEQVKETPEANETPEVPDTPSETPEVKDVEVEEEEQTTASRYDFLKKFASDGKLKIFSSNILGSLGLSNEDS